ncbi:calcium/sodium antiporter [Candidatus Thorarchaeota archaeon]|nr:MAG: calcium/sodium antiporter [Candidatus Thorarchaeota archaeon]
MQEITVLLNLGLFAGGLAILVYGSEHLIQAATRLAKTFGVSDLLIGLTIVAIGTSLPEIVSSLTALAAGKADLAFANVAGSSLTNLTLVVGLSALAAPLATNHIVLDRDTKIMTLSFILLAIMVFDPLTPGIITWWEGGILLVLMIAYLSFLHWGREECDTCYQFSIFVDFFIRLRFITSLRGRAPLPRTSRAAQGGSVVSSERESEGEPSRIGRQQASDLVIILIAALGVTVGAQWVVSGAEFISLNFGIAESVIGFTLIALGTSLPELTVSLNSARHGFGRLLIGNVVGSNIINITMGLGFANMFFPAATANLFLAAVLLLLMLGIAPVFYWIIRKDWRVTRREGFVLTFLYFTVLAVLVWASESVF